ncbi:MAG: PEP-CTERM sorting domain-containing protein [Deltaproteobacteria bacterium]|nr:PEP-CTERM sorting domain-containing protein [Deltaproteobacteria bacterium]
MVNNLATPVPEPETTLLLVAGSIGLVSLNRRRRRRTPGSCTRRTLPQRRG